MRAQSKDSLFDIVSDLEAELHLITIMLDCAFAMLCNGGDARDVGLEVFEIAQKRLKGLEGLINGIYQGREQ